MSGQGAGEGVDVGSAVAPPRAGVLWRAGWQVRYGGQAGWAAPSRIPWGEKKWWGRIWRVPPPLFLFLQRL